MARWSRGCFYKGWMGVVGSVENLPREKLSSIQFSSTHVLRTESRVVDDTLQGDLDRLWDLDSVGIRDKDTVLEAFEKNLSFEDGNYLGHLPWKEQHGLLPDNFENCVARLSSQLKHLRKVPEIFKEYDSIIQDELQRGIIEQVDCAKRPDVGRVHYLPHHGVVRWDLSCLPPQPGCSTTHFSCEKGFFYKIRCGVLERGACIYSWAPNDCFLFGEAKTA